MNGSALLPALATISALLIVSGFAKLRDPEAASAALAVLRIPAGPVAVAAAGVLEIVAGSACILAPSTVTIGAVLLLYAAFTLMVAAHLRLRSDVSCGCFGASSTPSSWTHLAFNLTAVVTAAVALRVGVPAPVDLLSSEPAAGAVFVVAVASAVLGTHAMLTLLPAAFAAYEGNGE
jgi:hypothetical protein